MCSGTSSCGSATMPRGNSGKSRTTSSDIVVRVYVAGTQVDDRTASAGATRRRARSGRVGPLLRHHLRMTADEVIAYLTGLPGAVAVTASARAAGGTR